MKEQRRGPGPASWWVIPVLVLMVPAVVVAKKATGQNVHQPEGECTACHSNDRSMLEQDRVAARGLLAPDLEERCFICHGDQGPSHHTGIRPRGPVPETLPLSVEGLITCATCHFMHGEQNAASSFVRIENSRGGLCLTCHTLSDLE